MADLMAQFLQKLAAWTHFTGIFAHACYRDFGAVQWSADCDDRANIMIMIQIFAVITGNQSTHRMSDQNNLRATGLLLDKCNSLRDAQRGNRGNRSKIWMHIY